MKPRKPGDITIKIGDSEIKAVGEIEYKAGGPLKVESLEETLKMVTFEADMIKRPKHGKATTLIDKVAVCVRPKGTANYTKDKVYRIRDATHYNGDIKSIMLTDDRGRTKHYSPKSFRILNLKAGTLIRAADPRRYYEGPCGDKDYGGYEIEIKYMVWEDDHTISLEYDAYKLDLNMEPYEVVDRANNRTITERVTHNLIDEIIEGHLQILAEDYNRATDVTPGFDFLEALQEI